VYTLRQFRPVQSSADAIVKTLESAPAEGLDPLDYDLAGLHALLDSLKALPGPEKKREFDLHLTYSLVRYVSQLCFGRIDPKLINANWPETGRNCDVDQIVFDALQQNTVENLAEQLSPRIPEYQGLKAVLQRYREIAASGGWQPLPVDVSRKRGARGRTAVQTNSALLTANLAATGDLTTSDTTSDNRREVSDEEPNDAMSRFQSRHGLQPHEMLDEKSVRAMNVSVEQRIEQIEINMDRMRWITHRLEPRHILVNIPGFQLSVHDGGQTALQMRAIVGSVENPTPVLDDEIEDVVFSPYWNIPLSIAMNEFRPKVKKDPDYLRRQEIEVVRGSGEKAQVVESAKVDWDKVEGSEYQLRQKPGTTNALGLVKFIFPNSYNVYLHDTPSDNLFDRLTRTLSHGCVRIERPTDLAAYVLQDQPEWTREKIEMAMHAGKEQHVPLKMKLPIHLVYWTAWADAEGKAQFREDVYGYDRKHRELVAPAVTAQLPAANPPGIHMDEVRTRVIPDSSGLHGKRSLPEK
jgi:murein L,D-transpeptidase YcbB/YkuD